jgi:predicted permease
VVSGLVPALQASRPDLAVALKAGEREGAYQRSAVRSALLIGQTGLTLVLLVGAGLFVRSLKNVLGLDLGVDTRHLLVATVDTRSAGYTWAETILLYQRMLERAQRLPGIEQAALSLGGPFGSSFAFTVRVSGRDSVPFLKSGGPYYNAVTPGFFATLGTRIVRGRGFTDADHRGAGKVAVLGQTMSRLLWPGHDALGQCIKLGEDSTCTQVVGIAADARRYQLLEDPQMQFYVPLDQDEGRYSRRTLFLRTSLEPHATAEMVRRALASLAPDLPYVNVQSVQDAVEPQLRPWRLGATVFGLFGGLALLLAAFGLYGMLAYTVAQRSQEMGVRIALGAEASDVVGLVVRQGLRVVAIGLGLGLTVALAASRAVASLLYGVKPDDPLVLAVAALVLVVAALVASYFPARRATRVDPVVALRSE